MKFSITNIAWTSEYDEQMYHAMKNSGFTGLEIAPTRIYPEHPYEKCKEAKIWASELKKKHGFDIPSMQSIWYGRTEMLFGSKEEREALLEYTKKAIDFAEIVGCKNLVFGCPRNRNMPKNADETIAMDFFYELGEYALMHNTAIGMEANPQMYNTNFINTTESAIRLIETVNSKGFLLNLDVGTMIANQEDISILKGKEHLINHVHISEPGLKPIIKRKLHLQVVELLKRFDYKNFVSIEVGKQDNINDITKMMEYLRNIVGDRI